MKTFLFYSLFFFQSTLLYSQLQLGSDIIAEESGNGFSYSVDVSNDGKTMISGANHLSLNDGYNYGKAYVYKYDENILEWIQKGQVIQGDIIGGNLGTVVSISGDGNRIVVGIPQNGSGLGINTSQGIVRAYEYDGTSWQQIGQDIIGESFGDHLGEELMMSSNGERIILGNNDNDSGGIGSGKVFVYEYDGNNWVPVGEFFTGETYDYFGDEVAISGDGMTIAFSSSQTYNGEVSLYGFNGTAWIPKGQVLMGSSNNEHFGNSISFSETGNRIAIGSPGNNDLNDESGHAEIYEFDGTQWIEIGDINGSFDNQRFGNAVSLSNDGNRVLVGIYRYSTGEVRVYDYDGNEWEQFGGSIIGLQDEFLGHFESTVLSGNGCKIALGGKTDLEEYFGAVKIYTLPGTCRENPTSNSDYEDEAQTLNIYPNPARGIVNLNLPREKGEEVNIRLYNITGQLLQSRITSESDIALDLSNYTNGTYFLQVNIKGESYHRKVLKQ